MRHLSSKKLILAFLYASGKTGEKEPVTGITRLEKMIFLLTKKEFDSIFNELDYRPDRFGPYSDKLADQIENLCDLKLIKKTVVNNQDAADELNYYGDIVHPYKFELTKYGEVIAKNVYQNLSPQERIRLTEIKKKFNSKSLHTLLSFVYNTVDEKWLKKSEIKDKYVLY